MDVLVTIPHFFAYQSGDDSERRYGSRSDKADERMKALGACIRSLHQHFGESQSMIHLAERRTLPANKAGRAKVHVVVCTRGDDHLLTQLPSKPTLFEHFTTDAEPPLLGYECHAILRDRWGNYDYYCYMEDDLILHDPWLFAKLRWFNACVGEDKVLQPNRFERGAGPRDYKVYVDGDLADHVTGNFQNIQEEPHLNSRFLGESLVFQRARNPHSGCFFLNSQQMEHWINKPYFLDRSTAFIGALESAATLGIMRTFKVYKTSRDHASFLEVEHFGSRFAKLIRYPKTHDSH